jgi:hypothetical protein
MLHANRAVWQDPDCQGTRLPSSFMERQFPVPPMKTYHLSRHGQPTGTLPESGLPAMLTSGQVLPEDLCWTEGMAEWRPVREVIPLPVEMPPPPQLAMGTLPPALPAPPTRMGDDAGIRMLLPVGRSGWAIAAGYLGLFSLMVLPAPLALIVSLVAIRDIRKSRDTAVPKYGMGRAVFGLIMGVLGTGLVLIFLLVVILEK